ncbi:phosphopantetheine-binding protein [Pseudomonas aeruginosa]|nr:phosphopantetheine-binding protein [Pseudomonas aeruginosa]
MREDGVLEHLGRLDDQVKFNGFRIEAGRDRLVPGEFSRGERSLRHAHRGQRRPASVGRLPGCAVRPAAPGAERAPWAKPAALHVAVGVRGPGGAAQDAQRQDRPQGPTASPGDRCRAAGAARRSAGTGAAPGLAGAAGAPPRAGQGFYAAGGDSLRAVHLLATLRQRLSRRVPLQAFAGGPATPEALLELLRQAAPEGDEPEPSAGAAGLSLAERRLWVAQQLAPEDTSYNLLAHLRIVGATADAIEQALRQLLERHVALRRRVETGVDGPQPHALAAHAVPCNACWRATPPTPSGCWRMACAARARESSTSPTRRRCACCWSSPATARAPTSCSASITTPSTMCRWRSSLRS